MVIAKKYIVNNQFDGEPKISDFGIVEEVIPTLSNGGEYLFMYFS